MVEVGPLIYGKLHRLPIRLSLCALRHAKHELTEEFLSALTQMTLAGKGRQAEKLNPEWVTLVEVLRELGQQPYASPAGRTIFQKICYVLTEMGVRTEFQFGKGSYGPFADEVKLALHEFANRNWVQEEQLGQMMALRVDAAIRGGPPQVRGSSSITKRRLPRRWTLFSRIKNTAQAEEVLTVLYASRQLEDWPIRGAKSPSRNCSTMSSTGRRHGYGGQGRPRWPVPSAIWCSAG